MARKHPDTVIQAVEILARVDKDLTAEAIQAKLCAGEAPGQDGKPYEMPKRTVQHHAQRARRDLEPLPSSTLEHINAIRADALRVAHRQVRYWLREGKKRPLTTAEAKKLDAWIKSLNGMERHELGKHKRSDPTRARAAEIKDETQAASASTLFQRIAAPGPHTTPTNGHEETGDGGSEGGEVAEGEARTREPEGSTAAS